MSYDWQQPIREREARERTDRVVAFVLLCAMAMLALFLGHAILTAIDAMATAQVEGMR